ncbi:MAG TPA: hypothetical protein VL993_16690 [Stellaceae bacterium]|nr:hypothetical protein [Stellaceae bacterium]
MRRFLYAMILCLLLTPAVAGAQEYVVIDSSVAALANGTKLEANATLDIPAKGRVVLLASTGQVQAVEGPYQGPPPAASGASGAGAGGMINVVAALATEGSARHELGVARAIDWRADAIKTPRDALAVDASDGGDICVFDPANADVIHDPSNAGTMTVQSMSNGAQATLTWDKGTLHQPWPSALSMNDGDMFSFEQKGGDQAAMATIHVLKATPAASDVERAVQMAQAGCQDQAKRLLAVVAQSAK